MKKLLSYVLCIGLINTIFAADNTNKPEQNSMGYFAALKSYFLRQPALSETNQQKIKPSTFPITEYLEDKKILNLILTHSNDTKIEKNSSNYNSWTDILWYQLSPQKKYFLISTTTLSDKNSSASTMARLMGEFIGKQSASDIIKLINTSNLKDIASFEGTYITHQWSPNETSFIIATVQKGWKEQFSLVQVSKKGASHQPDQSRYTPSGEVLRYQLFDMASQSIIKTFENIKSITYIDDNNLLITHDNDRTYPIRIERQAPLSLLQRFTSFFVNPSTIKIFEGRATEKKAFYTASYDPKNLILTVTDHQHTIHIFKNIINYSLSQKENYMIITQIPQGISAGFTETEKAISGAKILNNQATFLNLKTGAKKIICRNIVTYEFSPQENILLFLGGSVPSEYIPDAIAQEIPSEKLTYQAMTINTETIYSLEDNYPLKAAYFTQYEQLILVNNQGIKQTTSLKKEPIPNKNNTATKTGESAWQAIQYRGIDAIKEAATSLHKNIQESGEKILDYMTLTLPEEVNPKNPQEETVNKIYAELPPELQAIVDSQNIPAEEKQEENSDSNEEYYDFPDDESQSEEYFDVPEAKDDSNSEQPDVAQPENDSSSEQSDAPQLDKRSERFDIREIENYSSFQQSDVAPLNKPSKRFDVHEPKNDLSSE